MLILGGAAGATGTTGAVDVEWDDPGVETDGGLANPLPCDTLWRPPKPMPPLLPLALNVGTSDIDGVCADDGGDGPHALPAGTADGAIPAGFNGVGGLGPNCRALSTGGDGRTRAPPGVVAGGDPTNCGIAVVVTVRGAGDECAPNDSAVPSAEPAWGASRDDALALAAAEALAAASGDARRAGCCQNAVTSACNGGCSDGEAAIVLRSGSVGRRVLDDFVAPVDNGSRSLASATTPPAGAELDTANTLDCDSSGSNTTERPVVTMGTGRPADDAWLGVTKDFDVALGAEALPGARPSCCSASTFTRTGLKKSLLLRKYWSCGPSGGMGRDSAPSRGDAAWDDRANE